MKSVVLEIDRRPERLKMPLDEKMAKTRKETARLLQVARHRMTRWFRPPSG